MGGEFHGCVSLCPDFMEVLVMDKDTRVFETSEAAMGNLVLFRRKRQAARASREMETRLKDKKKEPEVGIALAHSRRSGFKWCVTESQVPVRRK